MCVSNVSRATKVLYFIYAQLYCNCMNSGKRCVITNLFAVFVDEIGCLTGTMSAGILIYYTFLCQHRLIILLYQYLTNENQSLEPHEMCI